MDIIQVSQQIGKLIEQLESAKKELKIRCDKKAETSAKYDKSIASVLIGLKNGKSYELDGVAIANPPASIMDKVARGICWQEKLNMDLAEEEYKSLIKGIDIAQSQLMGWQSIFKYQADV